MKRALMVAIGAIGSAVAVLANYEFMVSNFGSEFANERLPILLRIGPLSVLAGLFLSGIAKY